MQMKRKDYSKINSRINTNLAAAKNAAVVAHGQNAQRPHYEYQGNARDDEEALMGMEPGPGQEPYDDGQNDDYEENDQEDGNYDIPDLQPHQVQSNKQSHRVEENIYNMRDQDEDNEAGFGRMNSFKGNAKDIYDEEH